VNTPAAAAHGNDSDLLCLGGAGRVLDSHGCALVGGRKPDAFGLNDLAGSALWALFALSGKLVAQTGQRAPELSRFFVRRLGRTVPCPAAVRVTAMLLRAIPAARAAAAWRHVLARLAARHLVRHLVCYFVPCFALEPRRQGAL